MSTGDGTPFQESAINLGGMRVGVHLGRYELLHEIATGGMATVYLARARAVAGFERVVAIKVCHPHLRHEEEFSSMFLDEARLAAKIHHPNVVSTLDVGEADSLYLVMEYIEGDRISGLIKAATRTGGRMPIPITLRIMIDVLAGLHAAHELKDHQGSPLNIVHRDVSPQNILVGVDGVTRITDFGIAKAEARATVTREGQVKGKMSYMAPEQLTSTNVNRRADIYAAAVVLWEALTGRRLFRAESDAETLNLVLHGVVPPPSTVAPEIPPELDEVMHKALERDPDKRFQTTADFADALEALTTLKVATSRAVSTYINELLAEPIEKRRALVRKLNDTGPQSLVPGEHSGVRSASGISNPFAPGGSTRTSAPPGMVSPPALFNPSTDNVLEIDVEPEPEPRRKVMYIAAAAVAVLLLLVGGLAFRANVARERPSPPVATLPAPPPVLPPVPAEPASPTTPEPTVQAPTDMVLTPEVEDPRPRRVGVRPVVRPVRPAAPRPGGNAAPPGSNPRPAQPTPPGEFRPSGI